MRSQKIVIRMNDNSKQNKINQTSDKKIEVGRLYQLFDGSKSGHPV